MNTREKIRRPRVGCLFFGCQRFLKEGEGTKDGLYEQRAQNRAQIITSAFREKNLEVCFPGVIYSLEDVDKAYNFFNEQQVDCVICYFVSFAEDEKLIRFLRINKHFSMAYLNIIADDLSFADCYDYNDFVEFLASSSLVGTCVGSGSIRRFQAKTEIISGSLSPVVEQVVSFADASRVAVYMKHARFALMPAYNLLMRNTYVDPYGLLKIGPDLNFISFAELAAISEKISNNEVEEWKNSLMNTFHIDHKIEPEKLEASIRYSLGLDKIIENYNLDALALHDAHLELFKTIGLRPGFYSPGINEKSSVLVPEGDIGAAYMALVLKLLTQKQTNFIEPFFIRGSTGTFYGGHGGPNDYNNEESRDYTVISKDMRNEKSPFKYPGAPFAWLRIPPGKMTLAQFSEINGQYNVVCFLADSISGKHMINGYAHSEFRPEVPVTDLFNKLLEFGITQHFIGVKGNWVNHLRQFAECNGFTFYYIS